MRVFVTGASGVLGKATVPLLAMAPHEIFAPERNELDLFDPAAVREALTGIEAVLHLATRIPPASRADEPDAWAENDRLRADASRVLVDAALSDGVAVYVQPSVTFVYPPGEVDESTPVGAPPERLRSVLVAESEARRFAAAGRTGVVLRLGLLWGPGTGHEEPDDRYGATLHVEAAARALAAAPRASSGTYNVVDDGGRVANRRFKRAVGWRAHPGVSRRPNWVGAT